MKWLFKINTKHKDDVMSQNIVLFRVFIIGISYCQLNGSHVELTLGVGPISSSFGISIWKHLLP